MTARRALALTGLAVTGVVALGGCGGGDDTTSTVPTVSQTSTTAPAPALTKEQFIAQADAICAAGDKTINAAVQALGDDQPSQADLQQFAQIAVPALQVQVDAIRALPPPSGDEEQITSMLDAVQDGVDEIKSDPSAIEADPLKQADELAQDYGLQQCGSD
jgi:hypothetical protein